MENWTNSYNVYLPLQDNIHITYEIIIKKLELHGPLRQLSKSSQNDIDSCEIKGTPKYVL